MKALVIVANGLHLGYLGCYGNDWISTPALDRLASEGIVFDQHYADHPDLAGACRAWRSGCYQFPRPEDEAVPPGVRSDLLSLLKEQGVSTSLVIDGSRPFQREFAAPWEQVQVVPAVARKSTPLERTHDAVHAALEQLATR